MTRVEMAKEMKVKIDDYHASALKRKVYCLQR